MTPMSLANAAAAAAIVDAMSAPPPIAVNAARALLPPPATTYSALACATPRVVARYWSAWVRRLNGKPLAAGPVVAPPNA